ncbi:hypothetical protein ORV05_26320 [Amycolatopsis cynarae]|uniref:Uncharacterized protein n=1 Tax=Amycolatopsis cynarae TaxID=2995223 RepID=A0ABY7AZT1_9PSEU|nr:hypothetical protein [Amycolatopsis sp. HUAS 11-8]WAL64462.1 hypothetical protein ORV05_26320 [Amycolatopsis sp. HUAS 11-8]
MNEPTKPLTRAEAIELYISAAPLCSSPHVADLLMMLVGEYLGWLDRAEFRETSSAISAAIDWRHEASVPSYRELERRRNAYSTPARTPEQIKAAADYSWRRVEREIAEQHRGAAA